MKRLFPILFLALLISDSNLVLSETTTDLKDSKIIDKFERDSDFQKRRQFSDTWLPKGKNYSRLFSQAGGHDLIHSWVNLATTKFKSVDEFSRITDEYVYATKDIVSAESEHKFQLEIYVPHPRYETMARHNLVKDLAKLEPPELKVEYTEDIVIQGYQAQLHKQDENTCSILIKLEKEARVNLSGLCVYNDEMSTLANQLSLRRFNEKLTS